MAAAVGWGEGKERGNEWTSERMSERGVREGACEWESYFRLGLHRRVSKDLSSVTASERSANELRLLMRLAWQQWPWQRCTVTNACSFAFFCAHTFSSCVNKSEFFLTLSEKENPFLSHFTVNNHLFIPSTQGYCIGIWLWILHFSYRLGLIIKITHAGKIGKANHFGGISEFSF